MAENWHFVRARRLPDGRYRVERSDGAGLSLTVEDWQKALAAMPAFVHERAVDTACHLPGCLGLYNG